MFKFIVAFALVAVVNCDVSAIPHSGKGNFLNPKYAFDYKVHDSASGDSKNHIEASDGNVVQGEYSLIDADGFRRIVKYTADDVNGFKAVVDRQPITPEVPVPVAVKEPVVVQSPVGVAPVTSNVPIFLENVSTNYVPLPIVKTTPTNLGYETAYVVYRSVPLSYNAANFVTGPYSSYTSPIGVTQLLNPIIPSVRSNVISGGW